MPNSIEYDLIIAGSGLAGLRAAIEAAKKNSKIKIGVIAKTQVMRSHSVSAEGGTAAVIPENCLPSCIIDVMNHSLRNSILSNF